MNLDAVLQKLEGVTKNCNGYVAKCPAHEDRKASLSVGLGDDGKKILLKCHAGCTFNEIAARVGLEPETSIVAEYDYVDANGALLFQCVRFDPKDFRQRRPDGAGGWLWNLKGVNRVLYRLPELLEADAGAWVFVVEGEKDVETLKRNKIVSTTNPMGAGKWKAVDASPLHRLRVAVIADNDKTGLDHAREVCRSLNGKAVDVRLIELPGVKPKGDVSDWLAAGNTIEQLRQLVENTPTWSERTDLASNEAKSQSELDAAAWKIESAPSILTSEDPIVDWIGGISGLFTRGCSTFLVGLPKCGKTTFNASNIADFDRDGLTVLVITEEGRKHWRPRIERFGYSERVRFIFRPFKGKPSSQQWEALIAFVVETGADVVIFDTLANLWPSTDENSPDKCIPALAPLTQILEANSVLILLHHAGKSDKGQGMAGRGSNSIQAWVDIVLELRRTNPDAPEDGLRTINGWGRWDEIPAELVIERTSSGFHAVGQVKDARQNKRLSVIQAILEERGPGSMLAVDAILLEWPADTKKPSRSGLQTDLFKGWDKNLWQRSGTGHKGDPYLYSSNPVSGRISNNATRFDSSTPLEKGFGRIEYSGIHPNVQIHPENSLDESADTYEGIPV